MNNFPDPAQFPVSPELIATAILVLAVALAAVLLLNRGARYVPQKSLFSQGEMAFFRALEKAAPASVRIFAKVRVADIVTPAAKPESRRWWAAFRPVAAKHIDYVLVDRDSGAIRAAVELDDATHGEKKRVARDKFLNRTFNQAGVPLLRVPAQARYDVEALRSTLAQRL